MSDSDSFIEEVTEEVRRDRLYSALRKYGWIGIVAVILIVGGAGWNEYRKSAAQAKAEALGDDLLAALNLPEPDGRVTALTQIPVSGDMTPIVGLLAAAEDLAAEDKAAAAAQLEALAGDTNVPQIYSDLAAFKLVMLGGDTLAPDVRAQLLDRLAAPGAPFRPLAMEQQVIDLAAAGDTDAAIAAARSLLEESQLSEGLLRRMSQLIVALGAGSDEEAG